MAERGAPIRASGLARGPRSAPLAAVLSLLLAGSAASGQDRTIHRFGPREGLRTGPVYDIEQDSSGFVWFGAVGRLYRYDGRDLRARAFDGIDRRVVEIVPRPSGGLVVRQRGGGLHEIDGGAASPVTGPEGAPVRNAEAIAGGPDGRLWAVLDGRLWMRDRRGRWSGWPRSAFGGVPPEELAAGPHGVDVATDSAVWALEPGGAPRRLVRADRVQSVARMPDGRRYLITFDGDVLVWRKDSTRRVLSLDARGIDLVRRGPTLWASFDRYLAALEGGRPRDVIGPREGLGGGGHLLVDHEGSLWVGGLTGMLQFPEPSTTYWGDDDGLPSSHARHLAGTDDTLWVATWQGVGRLHRTPSGWRADTVDAWGARDEIAMDGHGALWASDRGGLRRVAPGASVLREFRSLDRIGGLAPARGGGVWIAGADQLALWRPGVQRVRRTSRLPVPEGAWIHGVARGGDGRLWITAGERICSTPAPEPPALPEGAWRCDKVAGVEHFTGLLSLGDGALWASSLYGGVFRRRAGAWEPHPINRTLPSRSVENMVPAASGGVWILGSGMVWRVRRRSGRTPSWEVVERLSQWHGLQTGAAGDIHEEDDGTVWLATSRGVARVPARARSDSMFPPRVSVAEVSVAGERASPDAELEVPHGQNRLEVRFAALSYRAPGLVRYQVRLRPDEAWSRTRQNPVVRFSGLAPGDYTVEVRASLDGENWSARPAALSFRVRSPWYRRPAWIAALLAAGLVLAGLLYRARVGHLLRLERQRTRIAMDLHDEMGSSLGSIGLLAGILRGAVEDAQHRDLAREIESTAEELGSAVSDLVWALDPREATLQDLAYRLLERGRDLFAGKGMQLTTRFPEAWPGRELASDVRRGALLIGQEALRNAARHADPSRVDIAVERHGPTWRLTVEDDGCGLGEGRGERDGAAGEASGFGMASMRRRAAEIGAEITWKRGRAGGTRVDLVLPPSGPGGLAGPLRRWARRLTDGPTA